jgi:heterodisulfide reductase subunit D
MLELEKYRSHVYTCARCGVCREKYDRLTRKVCVVREHTAGFEPYYARGKIAIARAILEGELNYSEPIAEALTYCITCGSCMEACGATDPQTGKSNLDTVKIVEAMRADIANLGLTVKAHRMLFDRVKDPEKRNPYNEPKKERLKWAEGLNIPANADVMFFVGCTPSYRRQEMALATAKVLKGAGIEFGIHQDEWCCGSPLLRTGFRKLAEEMANHNVETLKDAKKVVISCAGCYKTFKVDYPEIIGKLPFEVLHTTELLNSLIQAGKLKLNGEVKKIVTYHDPCHLGRHAKVYEPPRNVLKAIPGIEFREMYPTRANAWCCGAGGGFKIAHPEVAVEIASDRIGHAQEVSAEAIATPCPFCKTNLLDAVNKTGAKLDVYDVIELVAKSMGV